MYGQLDLDARQRLRLLVQEINQCPALNGRVCFVSKPGDGEPKRWMRLRSAVLVFLSALARPHGTRNIQIEDETAAETSNAITTVQEAFVRLLDGSQGDDSEAESWMNNRCFLESSNAVTAVECFDFTTKEADNPLVNEQPLRLWDFISTPLSYASMKEPFV